MLGKYNVSEQNTTIIKKYKEGYYRLTTFNCLRTKGLECEKEKKPVVHYEHKLEESILRARSTIFELAICNDWDYFCTFTLDKRKYDRYNLEKFRSDFTQYIRNLRRIHDCDIKYVFIPETHKDGAWHLHGFISGVPDLQMRLFTLDEKLPTYIRKKLIEGQKVFEWVNYRKKFGFCDLEPIRNAEACSKYVTKYISKNLMNSVKELNHKTYYCSQGLKRATEIKRGHLNGNLKYEFENEHVHILWAKGSEDINKLLELIE